MGNRGKKAQGIIEFIIIFGAVFFFFIAFLIVIQKTTESKNLDEERIIAQNIALSIQDEISLASESSDGYYREFKIPDNIIGKEYNVSIVQTGTESGSVYVQSGTKIGISYRVLPVFGNIQKGLNTIRNQNGVVYLNS